MLIANILVVEDYAVSLHLLTQILRRGGHTSFIAYDGQEALEVLEETEIDLIISDLAMPNMNGIVLLQRLRADDRYAQIPVIMLTASGQSEDRIAARQAGATDFLTKPTSSADLLDTVARFLG